MKHRLMFVVALLAATVVAIAICGVKPNFIVKTSPSGDPAAGATVTFLVEIDQPAVGSQAVSITASNPAQFSSIPSTIYVANGQTQQSFNATLAGSASGTVWVDASCNGFTESTLIRMHRPK